MTAVRRYHVGQLQADSIIRRRCGLFGVAIDEQDLHTTDIEMRAFENGLRLRGGLKLKAWFRCNAFRKFHCQKRPENRLLREPLDAAGNRGSGGWRQQAQVRDLRRTRPCARGFPSGAWAAALARFASAACFLALLVTCFTQVTPAPCGYAIGEGGPAEPGARTGLARR